MGRLELRGVNLDGDDQADRTVHGGPDKAVYAYAREDYDYRKHGLGARPSPYFPSLPGMNVVLAGMRQREHSAETLGAWPV